MHTLSLTPSPGDFKQPAYTAAVTDVPLLAGHWRDDCVAARSGHRTPGHGKLRRVSRQAETAVAVVSRNHISPLRFFRFFRLYRQPAPAGT
jgi:hypothetical protein